MLAFLNGEILDHSDIFRVPFCFYRALYELGKCPGLLMCLTCNSGTYISYCVFQKDYVEANTNGVEMISEDLFYDISRPTHGSKTMLKGAECLTC